MAEISYTIIIPHYNTPELLVRCLKSIPVREDIQVIVIDDCSPNADTYLDRFPELLRPYLEYYSTPQGGSAGRARNIGLDHAKGKWIICMDADDLFVDDMEDILSIVKERMEDILFFNYRTVLSNDLSKQGNRGGYQIYFSDENINNEKLFRYHFDSMWGKLFKRSLIEKHHIRCDETRYGNDVGFSFRCGAMAKQIAVFNRPFFIITEREGSLASTQFNGKKRSVQEYTSRLKGALKIKEFIDSNKLKVKHRMYVDLSYEFMRDYPIEFAKYYFTSLINVQFGTSLSLPLYLLYLLILRRK